MISASFIIGLSREPKQKAEGYKVLGHCIPGCQSYEFDHEFWKVMLEIQKTRKAMRYELEKLLSVNNDHWVGPCLRRQMDEDFCQAASFLRYQGYYTSKYLAALTSLKMHKSQAKSRLSVTIAK